MGLRSLGAIGPRVSLDSITVEVEGTFLESRTTHHYLLLASQISAPARGNICLLPRAGADRL